MKRISLILFALLGIMLTNCQKDAPSVDPNLPQDLIFTIGNGQGGLKADGDCSLEANYAQIIVSNENDEMFTFISATFFVNEILYTQAVKLSPGIYTLEEFILWNDMGTPSDTNDDEIASAVPHAGSPFGELIFSPLDLMFTVAAFTKAEVPVEVICLEESTFDSFGFVWFQPKKTIVKEFFFFGDFCSDFFWAYEGTLYGDYPKVDMPAIFRIVLNRDDDYDGTYENHIGTYENYADNDGDGVNDYINLPNSASVPPLAITYINRENIEDRYQVQISIYKMIGLDPVTSEPVFGYKYYTSYYFSDVADALTPESTDEDIFEPGQPGEDGVFDFVVGFCTDGISDVPCEDPDDCDPNPELGEETAFAKGMNGIDHCFIEDGFHRWGWNNQLIVTGGTQTWTMDIWAGAGQCDTDKGTLVGTLTVEISDGTATVTYNMDSGYEMSETHLYIGTDPYPLKKGKYTVAPGQYPYKNADLSDPTTASYVVSVPPGNLYVIAHSVVAGA